MISYRWTGDGKCPGILRKLTISGGEPLEQLDRLLILLRELKRKSYDICIYTGWELEEVPDRVLELSDYIKTGPFVKSLVNPGNSYVGSDNQHMFQLVNGQLFELSK